MLPWILFTVVYIIGCACAYVFCWLGDEDEPVNKTTVLVIALWPVFAILAGIVLIYDRS